jgi:hypothetical protein
MSLWEALTSPPVWLTFCGVLLVLIFIYATIETWWIRRKERQEYWRERSRVVKTPRP